MKKFLLALIVGSLLAGPVWAESHEEAFPEIGPLPAVPVPADNPITKEKVQLGKMLFFDSRLSGDGSTSCATCHDPRLGWGDGGAVSKGYPGTLHWRNSQTVLNSAYYNKLFWGGEKTSLEKQAHSAISGNLAGNGDTMMIEERLRQAPGYTALFKKVFGRPPLYSDVLKAIAAFERAEVNSRNVPFDKFARGNEGAISEEAKRGLALFKGKAGCIQCHNSPLFSDQDFHALGVPKHPVFETDPQRQIALRYQHRARGVSQELYRKADKDLGLYYMTKREQDKEKFRTPSLRDLGYTAPYMHNGVFETLEEVVGFYDQGGGEAANKSDKIKPLNLTDGEKAALVAFLESLTGDEVIIEAPEFPPYEVLASQGE